MTGQRSMEQLLDDAAGALKRAQGQQMVTTPTHHADFYAWGWALDEATARLADTARMLSNQIARYGNTRVLRDDAEADPLARINEARSLLAAVTVNLQRANAAARAYHSAIGHIGVEVDPDAAPE